MKIAIYGVSRSGKDYLIERVVQYLNKVNISSFHLKGSATLNALSIQEFKCNLNQVDEYKKHYLRQKFINIVNQYNELYDVVFVDGHYAFFNEEKDFNIVFTESDKLCYDHFFYLDTLSEKIIEFSRYFSEKQNLYIQLEDVEKWKKFEIQGIQNICNTLNKELILLDEDTETSILFISDWIINFENKYNYSLIANKLVSNFLEKNNKNHEQVILLDCDNTLSINDSTYDFCDFFQIEKSKLKQIFLGDRYSSYQFFKLHCLYKKIDKTNIEKALDISTSNLELSLPLIDYIHKNINNSYIFALTVGIFEIWNRKILQKSLPIHMLLGNTIENNIGFFVTPILKKYIAQELKSRKLKVIAIGDSIIDIPMLECADESYIVAYKKLNTAVLDYFNKNKSSDIKQVLTANWVYPIQQSENIK